MAAIILKLLNFIILPFSFTNNLLVVLPFSAILVSFLFSFFTFAIGGFRFDSSGR